MSDKMRWCYGDTNPVVAAVGSSTVIEIGDLLWQDVDNAKPASAVPIARSVDAAGLQSRFVDAFLGVAMMRSRAGDTDPIRLASTGVFEFDCLTTDFELGDLIGPVVFAERDSSPGDSRSSCLANQQVEKASAAKYAVGRCAKRGTSLTSVLVDIRSTVMTGGVEGTSASGV